MKSEKDSHENRGTDLIDRGQKLERRTTIVRHLCKKSETTTVYMVRSAFVPEKDEDILEKIVNWPLHLAVTIASLRKSDPQLKETNADEIPH